MLNFGGVSKGILPKVAEENRRLAGSTIFPQPAERTRFIRHKGTHGMTRSDEDMYHSMFGERFTIRT